MAEQGSFNMETLQNMMQAMVEELKQDNLKLKEELKQDIIESTMQLADKIMDTNTRIDALEPKLNKHFMNKLLQ